MGTSPSTRRRKKPSPMRQATGVTPNVRLRRLMALMSRIGTACALTVRARRCSAVHEGTSMILNTERAPQLRCRLCSRSPRGGSTLAGAMTTRATPPAELKMPGHYIEKVALLSGEVMDEEIKPHQLLVHNHRDYHVVDVQARWLMSRLVDSIGDEDAVVKLMKDARQLGLETADLLAKAIGPQASKLLARKLLGLKDREYFFRYKRPSLDRAEIERRLDGLRAQAAKQLDAARGPGGTPALRVLLTGGTGFVGKEIVAQAAHHPSVAELVVLIRPKEVRDRKTGEVQRVISPAERGEELLRQLWLEGDAAAKIRFVAGDIEQPNLGVGEEETAELAARLTHVIHSAASVSFDDPYEASFVANVAGAINALTFSHRLQSAPGSPFVAHLGIETSYIHGRQTRQPAREEEVVFPRNFYNNYYELTKAMGSIETERFMLERGLRVVQLCPSIVIGQARTGNNRGDTKVVNAPVNVFGRVRETLDAKGGTWAERSKAQLLARMACAFPGDPSAELNIIPVDWVARGILAALERPAAVGERIHLATDRRLTSEDIRRIVLEELGVEVRLSEPTIHRNVTLPVMSRVLRAAGQERVGTALEKLGQIFGGYSEWGQPIHEVGNDHRLLGLPLERPDTHQAFRMLCRHNRWVQHYGLLRDLDEVSRREKVWADMIDAIESELGRTAGSLAAEEFREAMRAHIDLEQFVPVAAAARVAPAPHEDTLEEPLGAVDAAWLQMDHPDNPMIITAMVLFDEALDVPRLRSRVEREMLSFARFRQRVVLPAGRGRPTWQLDPSFDLRHHVIERRLPDGDDALNAYVDGLVSEGLNMDRPPWQIHVIDRGAAGGALVLRLHHCLGDGAALVYAMLSLTDAAHAGAVDAHAELDPTAPERRGSLHGLFRRIRRSRIALHAKVEALMDPKATMDLAKAGVSSAASLGRLVTMPSDPASALRGALGPTKRVAWSRGLPLSEIKSIGKVLSATVNDVLMSALAGAVRTYLHARGEDHHDVLRAVVPVNLRPPGETPEFGNHFGLVFLPMPVGLEHELERLEETRSAMNELKRSPDALISLKALDGLGRLPAIEARAIDMFTAKASLVASNVPGPLERLHVNGVPVKTCMFWVPQSGTIGVGVSILSYAGEVRVGVLADAGLVAEPKLIVTAFEQEIANLGAGLSGAHPAP